MQKTPLSPRLEGSRIYLKKHDETLAQTMFDYIECDRERLTRFLPWVPFIKTVKDELQYIEEALEDWEECSEFNYGIFRKSDDFYMGNRVSTP
jgi:hypothetical protein